MNTKMKMRILSLLLCIVMLVGLMPTTVWAAEGTVHYYGRNALSALTNSTALLHAYDRLASGVETSAETITVYNGTDAITQTEFEMVMDAYRRDYAHHFWLGNSYEISSDATSVVSIKPTYTMTGTDLETAKTAFEQKVTDILSGITSSMSEYEKELFLHDKLAEIVTYEESTNSHNAYGALVDGKAVCEGYAEALQYLLQRVGIQSFLAVGTSINPTTNTNENHEWNYVKIDGNYYHVDLTWDDQGEDLFHAYFNQTDTVIQEDHTISTTGYALPVCNSTTAQYFTGKDEYLGTYTAETVGKLLKDNDLNVHVYIPGTVNDFISWYQTNIVDIGTKAEVTGEFTYGYAKLGRELILYVSTDSVTTYTVTFADGRGMDPVSGVSGEYTLPECTMSKPVGKQFKCWSVNDEEKAVGDKITVTSDITVTAVWEDIIYTVTVSYDASKGTATGSGSYKYGEMASFAATPKEGYKFDGWYKDGIRYNMPDSFGYEVTENMSYEARFYIPAPGANAVIDEPVAGAHPDMTPEASDPDKYTVNFYKWYDSSYNEMSAVDTFEGGKEYELRVVFTAKEGYKFEDTVEFTVNGKNTETFIDSSSVTGHKIKFQIPAATSYPVTIENGKINIYGGTSSGNYGPGSIVAIVANAPESGKRFKEWTATDGVSFVDATAAETSFTMPAKPVTITATYEDIPTTAYTVTFDANGGTGTMAPATGVSGEYELPTCTFTAPSSKQFKAWSVGGVEKAVGDKITVTANTTVTAVWEDIPTAKTPVDTVNISDLAKPVVGEMPDNDITVSGTGVTVDDEGSYWGRFASPQFSPYYSDGTTAVDSVAFREGETYMFQLYLNAVDGYEFTADSKFYFAGKELPALDMSDLSKTGVMVNPSDNTQAIVYINMNDISHVHIPGDWEFNETHHWHKCTASGCDAGADVSRLPDYSEHSFVNGLCTCGAHQHNWSAEWSVNETHHWHECSATGCTATDNSGKDGYAVHDFTAGACVCGVANVITSIEISGITAPVTGATPINSATVDKVGAEIDEENTFWVRYDTSAGRTSDTYADGASVHNTPFRDGEIYLLQITIKPKTGYSFTADTKLLYGSAELSAPDAANPTASCGAIAPDYSMAVALINADGTSTPLTYTVTFEANGGTGTMAAVPGISGEYTLPANGFTAPAGKQFKAWSVGGSEKAVGDKITVTADTTVTAVWENIPVTTYTITFNANGGTGTMAAVPGISGEYTLPANGFTAPAGKQFKAWSVGGSEKAVGDKITVTADTTVTAVWEDNIVFNDDWYWLLVMLHSQKFDITATVSEGGKIAPAGVTKVQYSKNITYTITPDVGYAIKSVIVDDKDVGAVSEYTFKNVTKKHTIHAVFEKVNPYIDVMAGDWFYDDVLYVTAMGLMNGTGNSKFSPEITTDRAMLVTVLWRLEGCPVVDSPVDFFDVADGLWYSDAIDWASANGIVNGCGDGRFAPTDQITREQIMAILNRYAAYKGWTDGTVLPTLAQYKYSDWAENNVIWAENYGLLDGLGVDVSDMIAKASRAELAAYLHKFMKNIVK